MLTGYLFLRSQLASCRSTEWPSKRNAVIFLANQSFRIYFDVRGLV